MMRLAFPVQCSFVFAAGALLALPAGCSRQQTPSTQVLARVGDMEITVEEFNRHLQERRDRSPVPVDPVALLQELVDREVLAQNARKSGLQDDPEVREKLRDVLIVQLKERQLTPQLEAATISDDEIKAAYEREKEQFTTPERVRLALLFLSKPPGEDDEEERNIRRRLEAAIDKARQTGGSGESFGPIAAQDSEDQESRYRGGEIGWVERGRQPLRIDPAAIEAGFALQSPGLISDVIAAPNGFYVVKLLERQAAAPTPLAQVEPRLRSRLLSEKQEQILAGFQSQLRQGLSVEVHTDRLKDIDTAASEKPSLPPSLP